QLQAALAGALGQSFHAAVIHKATAIEHDGLDAFGQSLLGDHLTDLVRRLDVAAEALKTLLHRGGADQGHAGHVINDLGIDVLGGAEYIQTGALSGAADLTAHTAVTTKPGF